MDEASIERTGPSGVLAPQPYVPSDELDLSLHSPPTLQALRDATRDRHAALDRSLLFVRTDEVEPLIAYLGAMLGILEPTEAWLWSKPELAGLQPEKRAQKAEWIRQDLIRLGRVDDFPRAPTQPAPYPAALGVAYVLEGSTLGGRVLGRREPLRGLRFFEGYGETTASFWRDLTERLEGEGRSEEGRRAIVAGACETFDSVRRWLTLQGALNTDGEGEDRQSERV